MTNCIFVVYIQKLCDIGYPQTQQYPFDQHEQKPDKAGGGRRHNHHRARLGLGAIVLVVGCAGAGTIAIGRGHDYSRRRRCH